MADEYDDDYDIELDGAESPAPSATTNSSNANDPRRQARAQHNALERRRRDNIKDMYTLLSKELPNFASDKASRAQILKKTIETIQQANVETADLETEIKNLEAMNAKMKKELEQRPHQQQLPPTTHQQSAGKQTVKE